MLLLYLSAQFLLFCDFLLYLDKFERYARTSALIFERLASFASLPLNWTAAAGRLHGLYENLSLMQESCTDVWLRARVGAPPPRLQL